jgi:hypothetical protein
MHHKLMNFWKGSYSSTIDEFLEVPWFTKNLKMLLLRKMLIEFVYFLVFIKNFFHMNQNLMIFCESKFDEEFKFFFMQQECIILKSVFDKTFSIFFS